tara:strand:+ start:71 stop:325 length:255 start_codon:yes stop_codon:yes gene_type:complete
MWDEEAMLKRLAVPLKEARRMSIYGNEGRIFLVAAAFPDYEIDQEGNILLKNGAKMPSNHPDYISIIEDAKKQAGNESSVGRDL